MKKSILDATEEHKVKIYHLPDAESDEDEDFKEQIRLLKANIPSSVVISIQLIHAKGKNVKGHLYLWGVMKVENPEYNHFLKLKTVLITHMQDLHEVTQNIHYEDFHSERFKQSDRKLENEDMNKDQNWNSEMLVTLCWSLKPRTCKPNSHGGALYSQVHGKVEKSTLRSED